MKKKTSPDGLTAQNQRAWNAAAGFKTTKVTKKAKKYEKVKKKVFGM